jgi:5,10-methylenetetrahydromethanopterin reductase
VLALGASIKSFIQGQFRIPYIKPNQAIRETVEIVKRLFQGEHLDYNGEVFQTSDVYLNFTPCRADLPINLGVVGPKNLELAGEISDGLLLSICAGPEYVEYAMEHVRRGARRSARSLDGFEVSAYLFVSISEDERAAREAVRPYIALMISLVGESPLFTCAGLEPKQIERFSDTFAKGEIPTHLVEDWMIDAFAIAGSPKQCRESLAKIVDAGVTHPVPFDVSGETIEKIMRDVQTHLAPHFL